MVGLQEVVVRLMLVVEGLVAEAGNSGGKGISGQKVRLDLEVVDEILELEGIGIRFVSFH